MSTISTYSPGSEFKRDRYSILGMIFGDNLYRQLEAYFYEISCVNYKSFSYMTIYLEGDQNNELYIKDLLLHNISFS